MNAIVQVPRPANEPVRSYAPGTPERAAIRVALQATLAGQPEIPLVIGGAEVTSGNLRDCVVPHDHHRVLARFHRAGREEALAAVDACRAAAPGWAATPWEERAAVALRAAELLSGKYRYRINAAAMMNQGKTVHQAEIDAACELTDYLRFNVCFMQRTYQAQPESAEAAWNRVDYRPLEGFLLAVCPFNFVSIAGNLPTAPAFMGNTVIWKPASTAVLASWVFMEVLREAGLPDGVINFLPGDGGAYVDELLAHPEFAGLHFTGSNSTFDALWGRIGANVGRYRSYPRIVGETGGKDFAVVHPSADLRRTATALIRGAFEYQGQKCSATSRAYVPRRTWDALWPEMRSQLERVRMGPAEDLTNFCGAVIDHGAFAKIMGFVDEAKANGRDRVVWGGTGDDRVGWYVAPTVILTADPLSRLMTEEIFGPVLSVYLYDDDRFEEALDLCDSTSPFGLTGAVFVRDRAALRLAQERLRFAAGNFYINDKTTGAVVGRQPFGGSRRSGTNDKAGSAANLQRWVSARAIKESFDPPEDFAYPFMEPDS